MPRQSLISSYQFLPSYSSYSCGTEVSSPTYPSPSSRRGTFLLLLHQECSVVLLGCGNVVVPLAGFQLGGLHEEDIQLLGVALEEEGLGGVLIEEIDVSSAEGITLVGVVSLGKPKKWLVNTLKFEDYNSDLILKMGN